MTYHLSVSKSKSNSEVEFTVEVTPLSDTRLIHRT